MHRSPFGSGRVLAVVDDDTRILAALSSICEDAGFSVRSFASATDALRALGDEHVDAVVTDYDMPGLDGVGLARAIRSSAPTATPIVLVSGGVHRLPPGDRALFDAVLEKPFSVVQLFDVLRAVAT